MLIGIAYMLLIPPTALLLPLALGVALRRRWLAGLALAGLVLLALPITAPALNELMADTAPVRADLRPQAIVVLSAERRDGPPGGVLEGEDIGAFTTERVRAGVVLARRTGLPVLVSGGVLKPGTPPIAGTMARIMADEFRFTPRWVEGKSLTTWENAVFSAAMLRADGITTIYLVTTSWHMARSRLAFERAGLAVVPMPARAMQGPTWAPWEFVPTAASWQRSYYALHEVIGYWWYRVRG
jgi:uncharacterized SAM-binding protein YcdF (DUF218 family)